MSAALLLSIVATGFGLGVVHAFDPDHLMTVAALAARADGKAATLRFGTLWALGHGAILLAITVAVILLGWSLPSAVPAKAEHAVGFILITAGAMALWLRHPPHRHSPSLREKAPFLVGLVHGAAGSAAMLALIPATLYSPVMGLGYAVIFSLGVLAGMMGVGLSFDRIQRRLVAGAPRVHGALRRVLAVAAIGMGAYWLQAA